MNIFRRNITEMGYVSIWYDKANKTSCQLGAPLIDFPQELPSANLPVLCHVFFPSSFPPPILCHPERHLHWCNPRPLSNIT